MHGRFLDYFVDVGVLQSLKNPDWQAIFGRRGTGKTQLLGVLEEETKRAGSASPVLSVRFNTSDFMVSAAGREVPDKVRALSYFQTFIEMLANCLVQEVDRRLGPPTVRAAVRGDRARRESRILDLALEVLQYAQRGMPVTALSEVVLDQEHVDDATRTRSVGVHLGISTFPALAGADIGAGVARGKTVRVTEKVATKSDAVPRLALVRKGVVDLLSELGIRHLNILIDEWQLLDPTASTSIQPEFGELLKRTFLGTPLISVKIATNRYQTRFSNQGSAGRYRGLELNAEVFEAINLDRAILDPDDLELFFERLLFRRLHVVEPGLGIFDPAGTGQPDRQFLLSIFRDMRAFREVVRGSEAIPRRFAVIIHELSRTFGYSVATQWDTKHIQDRIREISFDDEVDVGYNSEASQLLEEAKRVVTTTGSRVFLVRRKDRELLQRVVDELLEKRLFHDYPRKNLSTEIRTRYDAYVVDYGLWLDWGRAFARPNPDEEVAIPASAGKATQFVIRAGAIDRTLLQCSSCEASFRPDSRSYRLKGLCPECFEEADPPEQETPY